MASRPCGGTIPNKPTQCMYSQLYTVDSSVYKNSSLVQALTKSDPPCLLAQRLDFREANWYCVVLGQGPISLALVKVFHFETEFCFERKNCYNIYK